LSAPLTFLFTDLENSTPIWEQYPEEMRTGIARHDELLRKAVESHHGRMIKSTGDGIYAVFDVAADGIGAALQAQ